MKKLLLGACAVLAMAATSCDKCGGDSSCATAANDSHYQITSAKLLKLPNPKKQTEPPKTTYVIFRDSENSPNSLDTYQANYI